MAEEPRQGWLDLSVESDRELLATLLIEMRKTYRDGGNAMERARSVLEANAEPRNATVATLIAYDLQAGTYVDFARRDPDYVAAWGAQLADILRPLVSPDASILEVGCGEATTLAAVLDALSDSAPRGMGFDISWSRIKVANEWVAEREADASLFVGDLFSIPRADNSIDVVYTSHSIEPNGGRELEALTELVRVAREFVVLVEPAYEFASPEAQARMDGHGYVKGLRACAEGLPVEVLDHRLLPLYANPLNPSGVLVLKKVPEAFPATDGGGWQCPLSRTPLVDLADAMTAPEAGLAYPKLRGIPLLRPEHAVIASHLDDGS